MRKGKGGERKTKLSWVTGFTGENYALIFHAGWEKKKDFLKRPGLYNRQQQIIANIISTINPIKQIFIFIGPWSEINTAYAAYS